MPETNPTHPPPSTPSPTATDGAGGELDIAAQIDALLAEVETAGTELADAVEPATTAAAELPADAGAAGLPPSTLMDRAEPSAPEPNAAIDDAATLADEIAALASGLDQPQATETNAATPVSEPINPIEPPRPAPAPTEADLLGEINLDASADLTQGAGVADLADGAAGSLARDVIELPELPELSEASVSPDLTDAHASVDAIGEVIPGAPRSDGVSPSPAASEPTESAPQPIDIAAGTQKPADAISEPEAPAHSATSAEPGTHQALESEVNDLLASFEDVLQAPEPAAVVQPAREEAASAARSSAPADLDSEIAALTSTMIHREAPTASPVPEIEPLDVPKPPESEAASKAQKPSDADTDLAASIAAIVEEDSPPAPSPAPAAAASAIRAASVSASGAAPVPPPAQPASKRLATMLAPVGSAALHAAGSAADLLAKPLASRPAMARGIGWIAINTIFLAACLWAFLIFVRWPAVEQIKPQAYDFAHGALPGPKPPESAHATADAHGDGHGEAADDGHGGKKAPAKKDAKKAPAKSDAKKDPKKDPKKDAKKKDDGGHH